MRDPVDIAEQQRDYDETYGTPEQRLEDWFEHELNEGDKKYGEETTYSSSK